jgi:hypothetical protein
VQVIISAFAFLVLGLLIESSAAGSFIRSIGH